MWCVVLRFALIVLITTPTESRSASRTPRRTLSVRLWHARRLRSEHLNDAIRTIDVSLISHTHGRVRRKERNIQRIESGAIKHETYSRHVAVAVYARRRFHDTSRHEVTRVSARMQPRHPRHALDGSRCPYCRQQRVDEEERRARIAQRHSASSATLPRRRSSRAPARIPSSRSSP